MTILSPHYPTYLAGDIMPDDEYLVPDTDPSEESGALPSTTIQYLWYGARSTTILLLRLISWALYPARIPMIMVMDICIAAMYASLHDAPIKHAIGLGALIGFVHGIFGRWLAHLLIDHLPSPS